MHENNRDRNPHAPTRRLEIVTHYDVPTEEATQEFLDTIMADIRRDIKQEFAEMTIMVKGKWL